MSKFPVGITVTIIGDNVVNAFGTIDDKNAHLGSDLWYTLPYLRMRLEMRMAMPWYKKYLQDIWNIPNALTVARLLAVPVYVAVYLAGYRMAAFWIFLGAMLTDILDGYIARKYQLVTAFGKLMDPLADKVMALTVMLTRVASGRLPLFAFGIIAGKELFMIFGGWLLIKRKDIVVYASPIGKAAQFVFCLGLALTFFEASFAGWPIGPDLVLVYLAVVLTLAALAHYVLSAVKKLKGTEPR